MRNEIGMMCAGVALLAVCGFCAAAQESVLSGDFPAPGSGSAGLYGVTVDAKGNIYGTTAYSGNNFAGTAFKLTEDPNGDWFEEVLHAFSFQKSDGNTPSGPLTMDAEGNLYGTTTAGGSHNCGTVFELEPQSDGSWQESILHSFGPTPTDGCVPMGRIICDSAGNLYGATSEGGPGLGTIFKLARESGNVWKETVLFSFDDQLTTGAQPIAGLILDSHGALYGTTKIGGTYGLGTAFTLIQQKDGKWQETVLHSFGENAEDGNTPESELTLDREGNLYGTTYGGGNRCGLTHNVDCGTVFELSPGDGETWTESILHWFGTGDYDGFEPLSGVVMDGKGNLDGATSYGGNYSFGRVYQLVHGADGAWTEKTLFDFARLVNIQNGYSPQGPLAFDTAGNLYGTTQTGNNGYSDGIVFEVFNPGRAGAPAFSVSAGTYTSIQSVKITSYTPDARIYYTINGDEPTTSSERYTDPIEVKVNETIKATAAADGLEDSEVSSAKYIIELPAAAPVFSLKPGVYHEPLSLTITDATPHASIYFNLENATTSKLNLHYNGPIAISETEGISAYAIAPGGSDSAMTSATYEIVYPPAATPVISPKGGAYPAGTKITITDATPGAVIYYTTNGVPPGATSAKFPSTGIVLEKSEVIEAVAVAKHYSPSADAVAKYAVQ